MTETTELTNALFDTAVQGIRSFADGVQLSDLPEFFDEGLSWPRAVQGLEQMKPEALNADPADVENLFNPQIDKLRNAGLHPMLAGAIGTNLKGIYYVYAAIVQTGQPIVEQKPQIT